MTNTQGRSIAIIPCYNEEATIGSIIIRAKHFVNEVLVIDDGSKDNTANIAKEVGATVIIHKTNKGKSAGIKTGFKYALNNNYDYVITLDGDAQHNPSEIPLLLNNLKNNGHDITLGIRFGEGTEMPLWRKFGKRVLDYTISFGNGGFVTDTQCGFRAFNKKAVENILPRLKGRSFSVEGEQIIRAHETGLKIDSEHISCKYENLNTSTKSPVSHGLSVLAYTIWLLAERKPLVLLTLPGFICAIIGFLLGIYTIQSFNQTNILNIFHIIIASILSIIGIILFLIGLLNVLPGIIKRSTRTTD
ncbi:MAG: glycosyltransferase family 2 protein [Candidatus Thermoplasmatota archaeon]|nr:glycosyltransferase family 2 protein [Candidatus Thermoplasmatota archaeon]